MAILSKGVTIVTNTQISATNLNDLVDAATFTSGAVDGTTTQLSSGAIIVKDAGISPQKLDTAASYTMAGLTASSQVATSILTASLLKLTPQSGYPTSGTIPLNLSVGSNSQILLAGNSTFTITGQAAGSFNVFALKNSTGGTINVTWPAFQSAGGSFPASLTAGQAMIVTLLSYGAALGDVYAVSSL